MEDLLKADQNDALELSIVIPTYNELENINILIPRIEEAFSAVRHEIVVVDDSSPDKTGAGVLALNERYGNIRLINRDKKEGLGAALRAGYYYAKGRIVISSDADLSFSVDDMYRLYEKINEGYDLVVGARHGVKDGYYEMKKPLVRIKGAISKTGNTILRFLAGTDIHDFSANFRAIRKKAWGKIELKENGNVLLFEMIIKAKYNGLKITEVPITFVDRVHGESKLSLKREIPRAILRSLIYIVKYRVLNLN